MSSGQYHAEHKWRERATRACILCLLRVDNLSSSGDTHAARDGPHVCLHVCVLPFACSSQALNMWLSTNVLDHISVLECTSWGRGVRPNGLHVCLCTCWCASLCVFDFRGVAGVGGWVMRGGAGGCRVSGCWWAGVCQHMTQLISVSV
jgi:hypothetical protein